MRLRGLSSRFGDGCGVAASAPAPRPRARPGTGPVWLSSDGRPAARQGMQTPHRSAELSVDASSLAVSCGSRGVSLDIVPPALSAPETPHTQPLTWGLRRGSLPVREASRRDPGSAKTPDVNLWQRLTPLPRQSPGLGGIASIRALLRMWRARALRCVDRPCCSFLQRRHCVRHLRDAITPGSLVPATSPKGDNVMPGIIAAHHHASTNFLVSSPLAATGRNAAFSLRHYRTPARGRRPAGGSPVVTEGRASIRQNLTLAALDRYHVAHLGRQNHSLAIHAPGAVQALAVGSSRTTSAPPVVSRAVVHVVPD